jgi:3-methyl-2-oxobutanoate hydroxymethyltransferase
MPSKITVPELRARKSSAGRGDKLAMVTAYDATFARMLDGAGVDAILVGDSLGMVIQGGTSTLPVTLDEVIYHCRAVARGTQRAHLIGDMPFMSYQSSSDAALMSAGRLMKEGGAESVKLEGGQEIADVIRRMVRMGIPVMAHVGLMPQRVHAMGGFKVQGRSDDGADAILEDAIAVAEAGAYAVGVEGVPAPRAERITVRALDADGKVFQLDADGLLSVCIQHEMDHLDGRIFVEYLSRLKQQRIVEKLKKQKRRSA